MMILKMMMLMIMMFLQVLLSQFQRYQDLISTRERDNQAVIAYLRQSDLAQAPGVLRALSQ